MNHNLPLILFIILPELCKEFENVKKHYLLALNGNFLCAMPVYTKIIISRDVNGIIISCVTMETVTIVKKGLMEIGLNNYRTKFHVDGINCSGRLLKGFLQKHIFCKKLFFYLTSLHQKYVWGFIFITDPDP